MIATAYYIMYDDSSVETDSTAIAYVEIFYPLMTAGDAQKLAQEFEKVAILEEEVEETEKEATPFVRLERPTRKGQKEFGGCQKLLPRLARPPPMRTYKRLRGQDKNSSQSLSGFSFA